MIMGPDRTYHAHQFIFSFSSNLSNRPSWLSVSFLLHVRYTVLYRIVSYQHTVAHCADTQDSGPLRVGVRKGSFPGPRGVEGAVHTMEMNCCCSLNKRRASYTI